MTMAKIKEPDKVRGSGGGPKQYRHRSRSMRGSLGCPVDATSALHIYFFFHGTSWGKYQGEIWKVEKISILITTLTTLDVLAFWSIGFQGGWNMG